MGEQSDCETGRRRGVVTLDDPLGKYLYRKFQKVPNTRTRLNGYNSPISYDDLLSDFEKREMPELAYRQLMKRVFRGSDYIGDYFVGKDLKEFFKSDIACQLYGKNLEDLSKEEYELFCSVRKEDFPKVLRKSLRDKSSRLEGFFNWKNEIEKVIDSDFTSIGFELSRLFSVIDFHINRGFQWAMIYPDIKREYLDTFNQGSVFNLVDLYFDFAKRFRNR